MGNFFVMTAWKSGKPEKDDSPCQEKRDRRVNQKEKDRFDKEHELSLLLEKLKKEYLSALGLVIAAIGKVDRQKEFSNVGHILRLTVRVLKSSERKLHYLESVILRKLLAEEKKESSSDLEVM